MGLSVLLAIASAFDPQQVGAAGPSASAAAVVAGFRFAFLAAAIMGVVGLVIALRMRHGKTPR